MNKIKLVKEVTELLHDHLSVICRAPLDEIAQEIIEVVEKERNSNHNSFICPKCKQPGLPSVYLPMCTACANIERRKAGEIKD